MNPMPHADVYMAPDLLEWAMTVGDLASAEEPACGGGSNVGAVQRLQPGLSSAAQPGLLSAAQPGLSSAAQPGLSSLSTVPTLAAPSHPALRRSSRARLAGLARVVPVLPVGAYDIGAPPAGVHQPWQEPAPLPKPRSRPAGLVGRGTWSAVFMPVISAAMGWPDPGGTIPRAVGAMGHGFFCWLARSYRHDFIVRGLPLVVAAPGRYLLPTEQEWLLYARGSDNQIPGLAGVSETQLPGYVYGALEAWAASEDSATPLWFTTSWADAVGFSLRGMP